jgi:hypothetical protein
MGLDGDELASGHLHERVKVRNLRRDPRAVAATSATMSSPRERAQAIAS